MLPSRAALETEIPQAHQTSNPKVVEATAQSRNDAQVIQDLQIENSKLREELQLSNAENQVSSAQACECLFQITDLYKSNLAVADATGETVSAAVNFYFGAFIC